MPRAAGCAYRLRRRTPDELQRKPLHQLRALQAEAAPHQWAVAPLVLLMAATYLATDEAEAVSRRLRTAPPSWGCPILPRAARQYAARMPRAPNISARHRTRKWSRCLTLESATNGRRGSELRRAGQSSVQDDIQDTLRFAMDADALDVLRAGGVDAEQARLSWRPAMETGRKATWQWVQKYTYPPSHLILEERSRLGGAFSTRRRDALSAFERSASVPQTLVSAGNSAPAVSSAFQPRQPPAWQSDMMQRVPSTWSSPNRPSPDRGCSDS